MLEKGTLHFHDFDGISKAYPLKSLKIKKGFKDGSGYKKWVIPVDYKNISLKIYFCNIKANKNDILD
jgi:hypothetical protein